MRHSPDLCSLPKRVRSQAPFLRRHYPASRVLRACPPPHTARPGPRGLPVGEPPPPPGLPVLRPSSSSLRATATTPAEPVGACVAHFPTGGSLPRLRGGSASAVHVSRPAQRSLALRPAGSLSRPRRPVTSKCFSRSRYLLHPLRLLPAGATGAGRDSHPLKDGAFSRRTLRRLLNPWKFRMEHRIEPQIPRFTGFVNPRQNSSIYLLLSLGYVSFCRILIWAELSFHSGKGGIRNNRLMLPFP